MLTEGEDFTIAEVEEAINKMPAHTSLVFRAICGILKAMIEKLDELFDEVSALKSRDEEDTEIS